VFDKTGKQIQVTKDFQSIRINTKSKCCLLMETTMTSLRETKAEPIAQLRRDSTFSAGSHDSLPLDAMAQRNIQLTTASGVHAKPISEYVLA